MCLAASARQESASASMYWRAPNYKSASFLLSPPLLSCFLLSFRFHPRQHWVSINYHSGVLITTHSLFQERSGCKLEPAALLNAGSHCHTQTPMNETCAWRARTSGTVNRTCSVKTVPGCATRSSNRWSLTRQDRAMIFILSAGPPTLRLSDSYKVDCWQVVKRNTGFEVFSLFLEWRIPIWNPQYSDSNFESQYQFWILGSQSRNSNFLFITGSVTLKINNQHTHLTHFPSALICLWLISMFRMSSRVCVYYCSTYYKAVRVGGGG